MAGFTGNGYLVTNIAALLAIPAVDRPTFRVALLVSGVGWYEYNNTATIGGLTPNDNPPTGRWFQLTATPQSSTTSPTSQPSLPWQIVNSDFNVLVGRSYLVDQQSGFDFDIIATFPTPQSLSFGDSIKIICLSGSTIKIDTQNVNLEVFGESGGTSPAQDNYGNIRYFRIQPSSVINEFVFIGANALREANTWLQITGNSISSS